MSGVMGRFCRLRGQIDPNATPSKSEDATPASQICPQERGLSKTRKKREVLGSTQSIAHIPDPHPPAPQPPNELGLGWPQIGSDDDDEPVCATAGTLNCLTTSIVPHRGQWAASPEWRIKVSKRWSHGSQRYS
jgi:hypothetical protein